MRVVLGLLLIMPASLSAEPPAPAEQGTSTAPQPVVLDWGGQFRLNSLPKNADAARLKEAAAAEERHSLHPVEAAPPVGAAATLGPQDPAKTRLSSRSIATDNNRLNVVAPIKAGPVSLGASYGKYRAVPTSTREVSAQDARVSLGIAF